MNELDFCQNPKYLILGHFGDFLDPPDLTGPFSKNRASSLFLLYDCLTPCKKSKNTDDQILKS